MLNGLHIALDKDAILVYSIVSICNILCQQIHAVKRVISINHSLVNSTKCL